MCVYLLFEIENSPNFMKTYYIIYIRGDWLGRIQEVLPIPYQMDVRPISSTCY